MFYDKLRQVGDMMKKICCFLLMLVGAMGFCGCKKEVEKNSLNLNFDFVVNDTLEDGKGEKVKVVMIAGQSNATGVAQTDILKEKVSKAKFDEYTHGYKNVYINYNTENGTNKSDGFVHTNVMSYQYFGSEIGLAEKLSQTNDTYFIIKYSYGGSNLYENWNKENECLYKGFVKFVNTSLDYLTSKNYVPTIEGICWMQGESDAFGKTSKKYYKNTKKLVESLRKEYGDIKWIDAGISDSPYWKEYKTINNCKKKYSKLSDKNYYIDTIGEGLTYNLEPANNPDLAHYDTMSQIKLGYLFAQAIMN